MLRKVEYFLLISLLLWGFLGQAEFPLIDPPIEMAVQDIFSVLQDPNQSDIKKENSIVKLDQLFQKIFLEEMHYKWFPGNAVIETETDSNIYEDLFSWMIRKWDSIFNQLTNPSLIDKINGNHKELLTLLIQDLDNKSQAARKRIISKALIYFPTKAGFSFFERVVDRYLEEGNLEEALTYFEWIKDFSNTFLNLPKLDRVTFLAKGAYIYDTLSYSQKLHRLYMEQFDLSSWEISSLPKDFKYKTYLSNLNRKVLFHDVTDNAFGPELIYDLEARKDADIGRLMMPYDVMTAPAVVRLLNRLYILKVVDFSEWVLCVIDITTKKILHQQYLGRHYRQIKDALVFGFFYRDGVLQLITEFAYFDLDLHGHILRMFSYPELSSKEALKKYYSPSEIENRLSTVAKLYLNQGALFNIQNKYAKILIPYYFDALISSNSLPNEKEIAGCFIRDLANRYHMQFSKSQRDILIHILATPLKLKLLDRGVDLYQILKDQYLTLTPPEKEDMLSTLQAAKEFHDGLSRKGTLECSGPNVGMILIHFSGNGPDDYIECKDSETERILRVRIRGAGVALHGAYESLLIHYEDYEDLESYNDYIGVRASISILGGGDAGIYTNGRQKLYLTGVTAGVGVALSLFSRIEIWSTNNFYNYNYYYSIEHLIDALKKLS